MWRFLHLTDPHLGQGSSEGGVNARLHAHMPDIMQCLRKDIRDIEPDFILATGDLASHHSRDAIFAARDLLDLLEAPYFPVGGDADFRHERSREWFVEAFSAHLPVADTVYSFTHKGLHFVVLDPWWEWEDGALCPFLEDGKETARWALPPHQLGWLEDDLNAYSHEPTVVALHYPVASLPDRLAHPERRTPGTLSNSELLLELFQEHPQVKMLLSGHSHQHYIVTHRQLTQVVTGALVEYPVEYREIQVFDDRLEVLTHGLSNETFASLSLAGGNVWPAGGEPDRSAVVYLEF